MALVPSTMLPLGTQLPSFSLLDPRTGKDVSSTSLEGKIALVAFICNHCPYVVHLKEALADFGKEYTEMGLAMICISSNDATSHPQDGPKAMSQDAERFGYAFPYLFDESQDIARSFDAVCTPDFFLFDKEGRLAYRGQFDGSRPGNGQAVTGKDLRAAADALLGGKTPSPKQIPSVGCNIKWRAEG